MMKKKDTFAHALVTVVLIAVVIFFVFVVVQTMSKGYVSLFGRSVFRVATGSMEPTISVGALLISEETPIEKIKLEDVICFRSRESDMYGQIITHRVVQIDVTDDGKVALTTRGDANPYNDTREVTEENYIGLVTSYTKKDSFLAAAYSLLSTGKGFLILVVFPVLLIAGWILGSSVSNIRKELAALEKQVEQVSKGSDKGVAEGAEANAADQASVSEVRSLQSMLSEEDYRALCDRLKEELLEEVKGRGEEGERQSSQHECDREIAEAGEEQPC